MSVVIPSARVFPFMTVIIISVISIPKKAGIRQETESKRMYFPIDGDGYFLIYTSDTQKGNVYKHAIGTTESIIYKNPSSIFINDENKTYIGANIKANITLIMIADLE